MPRPQPSTSVATSASSTTARVRATRTCPYASTVPAPPHATRHGAGPAEPVTAQVSSAHNSPLRRSDRGFRALRSTDRTTPVRSDVPAHGGFCFMKLTVVGCSGSFPSAESACSSYLVEADGFRLLLDMGNGALGELQRHCGLYDLDADLPQPSARRPLHRHVRVLRRPLLPPRRRPLRRHPGLRPRGHRAAPDHRLRATPPPTPRMSEVFDFHTLQAGHASSSARSRSAPSGSRHPVEAYGIRIEHGGTVAHVLRRHRRLRRAGRTRPRHRPVPVRGVLHARQGGHPGPAPQRPRGRRDAAARARGGWSSPTSRRGPTHG